MADAFVFPGGRVESSDGEGEPALAAAAARELHEEAGVEVAASSLIKFGHWITPSSEPRRFDTHFFITGVPAGQIARHDTVETVGHLWATPSALLQKNAQGELKLPPPTLRTLEDLSPFSSVDAALAWAKSLPIVTILPKLITAGAEITIVLPWDPSYAALPGETRVIDAAHSIARPPSRLTLSEGRWWADRAKPV